MEGIALAVRRKPKESVPKKRAVSSVAPGPALGFGLQETLLTHRLLTVPQGASLSLEVFDDVAVHENAAATELIQVASTGGGNVVADRHPKLWKTLYNWIVVVRELGLDPGAIRFVLYVSAPVDGPLVNAFTAAGDPSASKLAIAAAREELWGCAPDYPKRSGLSPGLGKFVNAVLTTEDAILVPLIENFELQCGSSSPHTDLVSFLQHQIVLEESDVNTFAQQMLGWVKQKLEMSLEKHKPAIVSRDDFYSEMRAFARRIALRQILQSFASAPSSDEKTAQRLRTYVRQLDLIEFDDTRILGSITDFLKAASERVEWARRGLVHPNSFDDLDSTLRSVWDNQRLVADAHFAGKPIPRGQSLYGNCMSHQVAVQGMTAPDYFIRGCFHRLADGQAVGWHPDYLSLLSEKKKP